MSETDMTDQYAELRAALAAGPTPGPWTGHRMGIEKDRIGEYVQASVNVSPGDDFFFICAKRPDGSDADLCLTGNGPTSAINTQYIIAANPEVIRALLRERDAAIEERDAALQACSDLANEMVYRGNSVAWWRSKATAYRDAIDRCWDALREAGIHPDGKTDVATAIRQLAERSNAPLEPTITAHNGGNEP